MPLLASTSDLVQAVTGSTQTIGVYAAWMDMNGTTVTPGRLLTQITTATTTTVVASPASSTYRRAKTILVSNEGTLAETVTLQIYDGTNTTVLGTYVMGATAVDNLFDEAALLILNSTSDLISVVTGSTQAVNCYAEWADYASPTITPGRQVTPTISTATTTTIVPSPGSSTARNVKFLSISNQGTLPETVKVTIYDGTTTVTLANVTLAAGYYLEWSPVNGWTQTTSTGAVLVPGDPIRVVTGTTGTVTSTTIIPQGSYVNQVNAVATTLYPAGATIQVSVDSTVVMDTNQPDMQITTDPTVLMLTNTPAGGTAHPSVVTVVVAGAASGAGVVEVYTWVPQT